MKKLFTILALLTLAALPPAVSAQEKSKAESAKYLQELVRSKVKAAAQDRIEDMAMRVNPKAVKLYKKVGGIIANSELAASICWDLVQLGLQTDKKKFAAQFAMRLRKYIPEEYKLGAEAFNPTLAKWFGGRIPTEGDCTTILYELGKNTYDAISQMSASEKQEAVKSGRNIQNLSAFFIDINMGRRYANTMKYGRQAPASR